MEEQMTFTHVTPFGKTDVFKVVDSIEEVPLGYQIWNIGRHNFPLQGYIPMAKVTDFQVDTNTLMAVPVGSETRALYLMEISHKRKSVTCRDIKTGKV